MRLKLVIVVLAGLFLTAGVVVGDAAKDINDEMKKLEGTWLLVTCEKDGKKMTDEELKKMKLVMSTQAIKATTLRGEYKWAEGKGVVDDTNGTWRIDPSKKPKTIDATPADGKDKGKDFKGICELDGDSFKTCFALPGKDRPTAFASKADSGTILQTWKREKK